MTTDAQQVITQFWLRDGAEYDRGAGHGVHSADQRDQWVAALGPLAPRSRVLDVGTGTGFSALLFAGLGHQVTAVDASPAMMQTAREKAAATGLDIAFEVADAAALPFGDGAFDAVTARHVLWTLLDPAAALAEWHRVLRAGGVLLLDLSLGRSGAHYPEEVESALPLRLVEDEGPVLALLEQTGFHDVHAERVQRDGHHRPTAVFHARR